MSKFSDKISGLLAMGYSKIDISHKDLDDIVHSGAYFGYNILNAPDINYTEVIVNRHHEGWIVQEVKDYTDSVHLRSRKNGIWGEFDLIEIGKDNDCGNDCNPEIVVVERPHSHPVATHQTDGFISYQDKRKLDYFKFDDEGNIILSPHNHLDYEEKLEELAEQTLMLNEQKADKEHSHEELLPIVSHKQPANHFTNGQVWIETEK